MTRKKTQTKREVIVGTWEGLGCRPVDERVLRGIQRALRKSFGKAGFDSPASIARVLADEGAELRHPEVIEFDARWREAELTKQRPAGVAKPGRDGDNPLTLAQVSLLIGKLEKVRSQAVRAADKAELRQVRDQAIARKQRAEVLARSPQLSAEVRTEQAEVAEWIRVWLVTPALFSDWVELRRRSPEFRKKFSPK